MASAAVTLGSRPRQGPAAPALPADHIEPRRIFAFLAMVFGMFMAILDIQIVATALPTIRRELGFPAELMSWVQTA